VPGGTANPLWGRLGRYFGLRTRVFDDFLLGAAHGGTGQVVLLGAGLDTRAFRLGRPGGCRIFELDRPDVLAFKQDVLDDVGARPGTGRVTVAVDLCDDWAEPLGEAGFDPAGPAVWLAEGLFLYCRRKPNAGSSRRSTGWLCRAACACSRPSSGTRCRRSGPGRSIARRVSRSGWI
jgi:methyltransferase (TIGR00027 family)